MGGTHAYGVPVYIAITHDWNNSLPIVTAIGAFFGMGRTNLAANLKTNLRRIDGGDHQVGVII